MNQVILVEIAVTAPAGGGSVLRFADRAVRPFPPSDSLRPNVAWDSRIIDTPPTMRRALFDDLATMKPALGVGGLTLANADRALNAYEGHTWGEISAWLWTEGTPFSAANLMLKGVCAPPSFPRGSSGQPARVSVDLYDFMAEALKPLQTTNYAGSNDGVAILYEGQADGLKGRPKPVAIGNLLTAQIPAPQVNPAKMVYQLHDGAIEGAEALFDRGDAAGYVDDGDLSGAAFDAANPAAAHYRSDIGRSLVKLTGAPVGQLTFGFKGDKTAGVYVETPGPVLARILSRAGIPNGRMDISIPMLASTAVVGAYAAESITIADFMAPVAASVPAAVLPNRRGVWEAVPYGPPKVTADVTLDEHQVIACTSDPTAPQPAGEIRVAWGRIWQTFAGAELAPSLKGTASEERLKDEWRWSVVEDATVKARYPNTWRTVEIYTALRNEADALALGAVMKSLLGLRPDGKPRRMWRVTVELGTLLAHSLGETVRLDYPLEAIHDNFLLVGEEPMRPRRGQGIWSLWG